MATIRSSPTATAMSGNFWWNCMGSSPMSSAVVDSFASAYPLVFRLYPRLSTAISNLELNVLISSSTIGDLPVPPTARFPTQIIGRLKVVEERSFLSKHQLRIFTTSAYSSETGNKSILTGLSSGKLNFIIQIHRMCAGDTLFQIGASPFDKDTPN